MIDYKCHYASLTPPRTLYISGPISDAPNPEERFKKIEWMLKEGGHTVLSPMHIPDAPFFREDGDTLWVYYMKRAIPMLLKADSIFMMEGWKTSRGAKLELSIAKHLDFPVYYEVDF